MQKQVFRVYFHAGEIDVSGVFKSLFTRMIYSLKYKCPWTQSMWPIICIFSYRPIGPTIPFQIINRQRCSQREGGWGWGLSPPMRWHFLRYRDLWRAAILSPSQLSPPPPSSRAPPTCRPLIWSQSLKSGYAPCAPPHFEMSCFAHVNHVNREMGDLYCNKASAPAPEFRVSFHETNKF